MGTDPWRLSTGGRCYLAHPGTLLGGYNRLGGHSLQVTVPVSGRFWSFQTRSKKEARTSSETGERKARLKHTRSALW